ncbi:MAG: hypothetical protein M1820_006381 [Bogoriella megaspora]|nr:MAG: hypothetical protein M1820_006381 [Bogoriella megaspora]
MAIQKRLIVCCDGTWQASDKPSSKRNVESNVTRMCRCLKESRIDAPGHEIQQVVNYQSGVGTDMLHSISAKLSGKAIWFKLVRGGNVAYSLAGANGAGLNENVIEAYNFLCLNYEGKLIGKGADAKLDEKKSDEIFLFGFSRGAYTVRALAGLISTVGIFDKSELKNFGEVYAKYQERKPLNLDKMRVKIPANCIKIKVVGVWDTVGSLGVPDAWFTGYGLHKQLNSEYEFHDPDLSPCIQNAFHALALDEHRRPFSPTLWHLKRSSVEENDAPNLVQCWFPGVHINTGGGGTDELDKEKQKYTDLGEISDITFAWMVDLCRPFLDFDEKDLKAFILEHDKTVTKLTEQMKDYEIHQGGYAQGMINDSFDGMMAAAGSRTRAPGQYNKENQIVVDDIPSRDYVTNEYIHPSARVRITKRFDRVGSQKVWGRPTDQIALGKFHMSYEDTPQDDRSSGLNWVHNNLGFSIPEYRLLETELRLLENGSDELEIVVNPAKKLLHDLPAATDSYVVSNVWSSSYKAVLGSILPYKLHWWENEQKTFFWG